MDPVWDPIMAILMPPEDDLREYNEWLKKNEPPPEELLDEMYNRYEREVNA